MGTNHVSPATQRALDAQRLTGHAAKRFVSFDLFDPIRADRYSIAARLYPSPREIADLDEDNKREGTAR